MKPPRRPDVTRITPAMAVALEVLAECLEAKRKVKRPRVRTEAKKPPVA